jgi:phospho-N-acetylmuramoyl-pentapeptide-transferase
MGGLVIVGAVLLTTFLFWLIQFIISENALLFDVLSSSKLDFISRTQTWLPLVTFVIGGIIGFIDDYLIISDTYDHIAGGLSLWKRIGAVVVVGSVGGWWFFTKLGVSVVAVPFIGEITLGMFLVPFFVFVMLATYSGGVIDGLDGLSGGVFASIFSAYGIIAFAQNQINLATFCFVIVGSILAFLWFNIPPARFFMTETGIVALTTTLAVIAFLTEQVLILPIIALPLVVTSASSSLQLLSKKFRNGKKIFRVAPLHHHFQALGWPAYKVVMRYWVLSIICAMLGVVIALVG